MIATTSTSTEVLTEEEKYVRWCQQHPCVFSNPDFQYPPPPKGSVGFVWDEARMSWVNPRTGVTKVEKSKYVWLTVNPAPEWWVPEKFKLFAKAIANVVLNKPYEACIYVFEQESLDSTYAHPHLHALISRRGLPGVLRNSINKTFSRFVGNPLHIKIVENVSLAQCAVKMAYMQGHKKGTNKKGVLKTLICANDVVWRESMGFKPMYGEVSF